MIPDRHEYSRPQAGRTTFDRAYRKKKLIAALVPLSVMVGVFVLDQFTKSLVVLYIEPYYINRYVIEVFGEFFRLIHTTNSALAFSIGRDLPELTKRILFVILPTVLLLGIVVYYFNAPLSKMQRWALSLMMGGGFGNLVDRIFRTDGVVDFLDVKFYGIFGYERWPTFNVADSAIVVGAILLVIVTAIDLKNEMRTTQQTDTT